MGVADVLKESAVEATAEAAPKKRAPKKAKPKLVPKLDEAGNPVLDESGNPVMVKAQKKARAPKLDADGNPIQRKSYNFLPTQKLKITDKGHGASYREGTKRHAHFASIKDDMTVEEFYAANGGKSKAHTFLVWFVEEAGVLEVVGTD